MIHSSVKRWGNSPAVRIPATLMQALNLNIDDEVKIDLVDGKLIIEPVRKEPVFTLAELVKRHHAGKPPREYRLGRAER